VLIHTNAQFHIY